MRQSILFKYIRYPYFTTMTSVGGIDESKQEDEHWMTRLVVATQIPDLSLEHEIYYRQALKPCRKLNCLGSSVISTCVLSYLMQKYPLENESFLSDMKIKLCQVKQLAKFAEYINLTKFINAPMPTNAQVFQAFIGALFNTFGFGYCQTYITNLIDNFIDLKTMEATNDNYKGTLMRYFGSWTGFNDPRYYMVSKSTYQMIIAIPKNQVDQMEHPISTKIMALHHKIKTKLRGVDVDDFREQRAKEMSIKKFCRNMVIIGYGFNQRKKIAEQYAAKMTLQLFDCPFDF